VVEAAVPNIVGKVDSLVVDGSAISELLNVAYAGHELTSDYIKDVFDWFQKHNKSLITV
jgi:hypothetical protein